MEIVDASDRSLLVRLSSHAEVVSLARSLQRERPHGVTSFSPAYSSVLIRYDPTVVDAMHVREWVSKTPDVATEAERSRVVVLPVIFNGPDLADFALAPAEVIEVFCSTEYRVYFFGFVPGFAYMGDVDERIAMPRRATPRKSVPAGSVGIAGRQTGIYPVETPGGWNLIGRCTVTVFDVTRDPACLLQPGDSVRFEPA